MAALYDTLGTTYTTTRQPDPRIMAAIVEAIGDASSVVNVGAGTGSYEPVDRRVVAVDPSPVMLGARPSGAAPAIRAVAEQLPLANRSVDATLAVLTVHHWQNPAQGLAEMRRVARRRVVVLTWDQDVWESFWLVREYLPVISTVNRTDAVTIDDIRAALGPSRTVVVPIPHDCLDGFHGAFWRRPHAYLDPTVRAGISTYAVLPAAERDEGLGRLAADLADGTWRRRHADLLNLDALDLGYRLIVADAS